MHPSVCFRSLLMVIVLSVPSLAQDKKAEAKKTVDGKAANGEKTETASSPKAKQADKKAAKKPAPAAKKPAPQPKIGVRQIKISGDYVDLVQPAGLDPLSLLGGGPGSKRSYFKLTRFLDTFSEDDDFDLSLIHI